MKWKIMKKNMLIIEENQTRIYHHHININIHELYI